MSSLHLLFGADEDIAACSEAGLMLRHTVQFHWTQRDDAPWLDFAGMWLTKLVSPGFAIVTLAGGWAMALGYFIVAALATYHMWWRKT